MKTFDINGNKIVKGDKVVCVKPTVDKNFIENIDSEIGRIFTVTGKKNLVGLNKKGLVLDCHPYIELSFKVVSANPSRFIKVIE